MKIIENWFRASDGEIIFYYKFSPNNEEDIKYVIQISHGMAEHSERYKDFAEFFTARNGVVYINDHRGHGKTCKSVDHIGIWNMKNAWSTVVDDLKQLSDIASDENKDKKNFVLGHSMGSQLTRTFLTKYSSGIDGAILTGVTHAPKYKLVPACMLSKLQCKVFGNNHRSKMLDNFTLNAFNKEFDKSFEWLSRDNKVVEKYLQDPYCGGVFTSSFFKNLFLGMMYNIKVYNIKKIPKSLPMLLMSGSDDPAGLYGKAIEEIYKLFKEAGIKDVEKVLYQGARHEVLNETNNKEVYQKIYTWIKNIL